MQGLPYFTGAFCADQDDTDVEVQQEFVRRAIAHLTCVVDGEGATEGDRLYRALRLIACGPEGMQSVCSAESATASRDDSTDDEDASD
jgi:hypothetical protein